ncbi:HU family DNA-binding protein [Roseicella sp. DB1501]|jgi:DNA-binding protein HU-beta|uniref:HU family DNA-binding protein n=1 Tax=Roseicella sp. DB1501 TaxID=2730925 RepID=UPI001491B447|nr:HU family DNA-binding protein [Roseicella sp. DB1501]NOG70886.1 HU family DNA-binding protein [Roseicella sp. DB1501]
MSSTTTAKPAAKATTTTTLKQMAVGLAESNDLPKKTVEAVLNGLVSEVMKRLQAGEKVRLTGLGILQVKKRAARTGRNPATGAEIQIAESKKLAFTAAKEAKEAI